MSENNSSNALDPAIRRGKIDSLVIYEISESELDLLETGNPESYFLTFAVSLLSIAVSFFTTLWTTTIANDRVYIVFVALTIISFIVGAVLLLLWLFRKRKTKSVMQSIRKRLPPEGIPMQGRKPNI